MKKRIVSILNLMGLMLAVAQYGEVAQASTTEVIRRTASGAVLLSRTTFDDGSYVNYTFDPDNQYEYTKLSWKFDPSGTLVSEERLYDDGAKQVNYFYAASSPLLMIHQNYVPAGSLLQQRVYYRNGDLYASTNDVNGSQPWSAHHQMIRGQTNDGTTISGGTIDFNDYRMDDGTRRIERFDQLGDKTYTRFIDYLDKSGRVDYQEMFMDNGNRIITDYDETNTLAWKSLYKTFNQKGQLLSQDYRFDDGTRQYEGFDVEGTKTWTRYVSFYNAQSQLDYVTYYLKDGRRQVSDYDQASIQTWSTLIKVFDSQGRLDAQDYRMDDGTRIYIDYDQALQNTWSERRITYNSSGQLISQRITNDDGTVIIK